MSVQWQKIKARLLFGAIGLGLGLLIAAVVGVGFNTRIEELEGIRKQQLSEKTEIIKTLQTKYSKLETENKKIKSHVHIVERTNPDGSTEKIYDSKRSVESERTVAEQQVTIERLHHQRKVDLLNYEWEKRFLKETRPSASLSLVVDANLKKSIHATYNIFGPMSFGLWGSETGNYGLSLGISL